MAAIPICIPNNCSWEEATGTFQRDREQPRTKLQLVDEALRKLRAIHGPVCVVSIAGPCRRGKSYILSRVFDQPDMFPLGHSFDPETMGIWMWVIPEKYRDDFGYEFTVVLLDSEGIDAVIAEGVSDHAIFTLTVLLSSVLIYNSVGFPTRTDLEVLDHIINICRRIQVIPGQTLDDESSRQVFPSFVWLLRDVVLSLPKGVDNLREYFLEKVFKVGNRRPSDKSQTVVDNILKYFPDFDAFPLSPPTTDVEVVRNLTDARLQGQINSAFKEGVQNFKKMLVTKLGPKKRYDGPGLITGEALATLFEEYVRSLNSPGAIPVVQSAWREVTEKESSKTLENAKSIYDGGMSEFIRQEGLPCDDRIIHQYHEANLLEALSFFESNTKDIDITARWIYIEDLANYADLMESVLLRENKCKTEKECDNLMKMLRSLWLEPVLKDLQDPKYNTDFMMLESRLRSAYIKLDSDFREEAPGPKSLCSNLAYMYDLQHNEEMKEYLNQLNQRREYYEEIAVRKVRTQEVGRVRGTEVTRNDHRRVKDVKVHEQVVELAGEENMGAGSLGGLEEVVEEEFNNETETETQDDPKGAKVTEVQYSKTVTSEGTSWALEQGAVHLILPPDAVSEPTSIVLRRWKYSVRSPPLQENEVITSDVIELSSMNGQCLKFNSKVKLSLSHSATDLLGYELVIKKLIDKEANKWEDIDGTRDLRRCQDQPSHMKIPDLFFPVAQADISECSTYAVVCRLKASPTYTITSGGGSFSHPDFPGVTVTIPENAVAPTAKFPLELQVQEVSSGEVEGEDIVLGPVLRIKCNQAIQFLKPVNIQLPISLREQQDVGLNPPTTGHVRVLFLKSDNGQKEWIEITDDLVTPPSLDGKFVRFDVERFTESFSGYSHYVDRRNESLRSYGTRVINVLNRHNFVQPRLAVFFAYFRPNLLNILRLICCPIHLKRRVVKNLEKQGIKPECGNSKEDMVPGREKAYVSVSGGICPYIRTDMEQIFLRFLENHSDDTELDVCFHNDEKVARVEFYSGLKPTAPLLCRLHLKTPNQGTDRSDLWELTRQPSALKEGNPTEDELEYLSAEVSDDWRTLGRRLAFKEAQLQEFDTGYGKISEKAYAMLLAWKQRDGSGASYSVLYKALCDKRVKRRDLAQKFCY